MKVADFMTHRVITVAADATVATAARLMLDNRVSGLPVIDGAGRVVGMVTEHDLLRGRRNHGQRPGPHWMQLMIDQAELPEQIERFRARKVEEVMTPEPITVAPATAIEEACRLIEVNRIKRLPVLKDGRLIGIIARDDLLRAVGESVRTRPAAPPRDVSVDERMRALERQIWHERARRSKPF